MTLLGITFSPDSAMPFFKKNWFLLILLPIFSLSYVLYQHLINLPVGDDLYVMNLFNQLHEATNLRDKITAFFYQHNEHRIVITRLLAWVQFQISGHIDLRWWLVFGNISLLGMVYIFYINLVDFPRWWILPIAFVVIAPISNTLLPMQNSNLFSAFFGLCTLHFSVKNTSIRSFVATLIFSCLSIFSNSGGFALFPILSCVYFLQKRYSILGLWLGWSLLLIGSYYWHYEPIYRHPTSRLFFSQLPKAFSFFFAFLGSIGFNAKVAQLGGIVFLGGIGLAFYRKFYRPCPFFFLCMLYSILMAAMTTFKRYEYGITTATSERYSIYSVILTASLFIFTLYAAQSFQQVKSLLFPLIFALSIGIHLKFMTFHLRNPAGRKVDLTTRMENYQLTHLGYNYFEIPILDKLRTYGYYDFSIPAPIHNKAFYDNFNRPPITSIQLRVKKLYQTADKLHFTGTILGTDEHIAAIHGYSSRLLVLQQSNIPLDDQINVLTNPRNHQSLILNTELENDLANTVLPTITFAISKKYLTAPSYTFYFLLMNENAPTLAPIKTNVSFRL